MIYKSKSNKSIKWWIGTISCTALFIVIGVFAYQKMCFIYQGVKITAVIDRTDTSTSLVKVKGNAENATYLTINGQELTINPQGDFTQDVVLLSGLSVITLEAQDKFGHAKQTKFEVVYTENTGAVAINNIHTNITTN